MYLYGIDGLAEPPRIPNPDLTKHCPTLRDMHGQFVDWINYIQRTANKNDAISKSLADLGEKNFIRETDLLNYIARCKQQAQLPVKPLQPLSPELIREIMRALTGIRWPPAPATTPSVPPAPKTLKMRDI